jgi:hypothetical protein
MADFKGYFNSRQTPAAGNYARLRRVRIVFSTKFPKQINIETKNSQKFPKDTYTLIFFSSTGTLLEATVF